MDAVYARAALPQSHHLPHPYAVLTAHGAAPMDHRIRAAMNRIALYDTPYLRATANPTVQGGVLVAHDRLHSIDPRFQHHVHLRGEASAWLWSDPSQNPDALGSFPFMLGWRIDQLLVGLYPDLLRIEGVTQRHALALLRHWCADPWRKVIEDPSTRVSKSPDDAAQGKGYLAHWCAPFTPYLPARVQPVWDWISTVVQSGLMGRSTALDAEVVFVPAAISHQHTYRWATRLLQVRYPNAQAPRCDGLAPFLDPRAHAVRTMLAHPACPLQPVHAAGTSDDRRAAGLPALLSTRAATAHTTMAAAARWNAIHQDLHGSIARVLATVPACTNTTDPHEP